MGQPLLSSYNIANNLADMYAKVYHDGSFVFYRGNRPGNRETLDKARKDAKPRKFKISRTRVRSATLALWENRTSRNLTFITVTCPTDAPQKDVAKAWQLWLNNIYQNGNIRQYVWVMELQSNGRPHYHILLDSSWVSISKLQKSWETAYLNRVGHAHTTHNSVRLGERPIVNHVRRVAHYLTKYVAKSNDQYDVRAYGFSQSLSIAKEVDAIELALLLQESRHTIFAEEGYMVVGCIAIQEYAKFKKFFEVQTRAPVMFVAA